MDKRKVASVALGKKLQEIIVNEGFESISWMKAYGIDLPVSASKVLNASFHHTRGHFVGDFLNRPGRKEVAEIFWRDCLSHAIVMQLDCRGLPSNGEPGEIASKVRIEVFNNGFQEEIGWMLQAMIEARKELDHLLRNYLCLRCRKFIVNDPNNPISQQHGKEECDSHIIFKIMEL